MRKLLKFLSATRFLRIPLVFVALLVGLIATTPIVLATYSTNPPTFPTCEAKLASGIGDHDHSVNGNFWIIGIGWRQGTDDVYNLHNNNYLQCYCPNTGYDGIQSDWWNADLAGLTQDQINNYKANGWFEEEGRDRNLPDYTFLVRNREFSCAAPTPTITATLTPSVTPTAAPTATVTPTEVPPTPTYGPSGPISRCYDLTADKTEGFAPLTVSFTGHADDPSQNGKIKEYRFDFADANAGQQVVYQSGSTTSHTYNLPGDYEATLRIQDFAGNWRESDDCKLKIKVNSGSQVLGISTPDQLPATGLPSYLFLAILPLYYIGRYFYRRFRLV